MRPFLGATLGFLARVGEKLNGPVKRRKHFISVKTNTLLNWNHAFMRRARYNHVMCLWSV